MNLPIDQELIQRARAGDVQAFRTIFERMLPRVVGLAQQRLAEALPAVGASGIGASVFRTFHEHLDKGDFPDLKDERSLWLLLASLTCNKVADAYRREHAQRRGGEMTRVAAGEDDLLAAFAAGSQDHTYEVEMRDLIGKLLLLLPEELRQTAVWRMEGLSCAEIKERIGLSLWVVEERLRTIRTAWRAYGKAQGWDENWWADSARRTLPAEDRAGGGGHDSP
jgi:DNA-directed RNA polymerase specialized sigma24 family protein